MTNKNKILLVAVAVILLGGIVWLRARPVKAPTTSKIPTNTDVASTTTTDLGNGLSVTGPAGVKVTATTKPGISVPSLTHQTVFSPTLAADAVSALKISIPLLQKQLAATSTDQGGGWLQLAIDYKVAGDYRAAEEVWIFLTKELPTNTIAYIDLGDLYQNYLVNYPKAETNYLQALKLNPQNIDVYTRLFSLYKNQYKTNTTAAADLLARGLKANPNDPDLLVLQKQL